MIYIVVLDCTAFITGLLRFIVCSSLLHLCYLQFTIFPPFIFQFALGSIYIVSCIPYFFSISSTNFIILHYIFVFLYLLISFLHVLLYLFLFFSLLSRVIFNPRLQYFFHCLFSFCPLLSFIIFSVSSYLSGLTRTFIRSGCEGLKN